MILEAISHIIHTTLASDAVITRSTNSADIRGWDSLSHTLILMTIESHFNIQLPLEEVLLVKNVGDLEDIVSRILTSCQD